MRTWAYKRRAVCYKGDERHPSLAPLGHAARVLQLGGAGQLAGEEAALIAKQRQGGCWPKQSRGRAGGGGGSPLCARWLFPLPLLPPAGLLLLHLARKPDSLSSQYMYSLQRACVCACVCVCVLGEGGVGGGRSARACSRTCNMWRCTLDPHAHTPTTTHGGVARAHRCSLSCTSRSR